MSTLDSDKAICEDCNKVYDYDDGQYASDGTFYCSKCLDALLEIQEEQYL